MTAPAGHAAPGPRALLVENIHPVAIDLLSAAGFTVDSVKGALDEADLTAALAGVTLLGVRSKTKLTRAVLEGGQALNSVGAFCIGTNQIDLAAAAERGVAVFNAPFSNTRSVVELVLAEIISLARRLIDKDRALQAGTWDKSWPGATRCVGGPSASSGTATSAASCPSSPRTLGCGSCFTTSTTSWRSVTRCAAARWTSLPRPAQLDVDGRPGKCRPVRRRAAAPAAAAQPVPQPVAGLRRGSQGPRGRESARVALPGAGTAGLAHLHRNVPGALAAATTS